MSKPKILVVITARGGSKGVARKNIRDVNGVPLIAYAIKAALGVDDRIYKIVVSTDDEEIASIAKAYGAEVPFMRPHNLATDKSASLPVVQHAVKTIEKQDDVVIDWSILIQPTNPLITSNDITGALDLITGNIDATSIVSVIDAMDMHPLKSLKTEHGYLVPYIEGAKQAVRRQDLTPQVYKRNGSIYMTRRDILLEGNDLYGANIIPYIMPKERSIDIDTEFDLKFAEFILKNK